MEQGSWYDRPPGPRGGGAIWLGLGLLASYLGLFSPYLSHHAPSYVPLFVLAAIGPALVIAGISFLLGGKKAVLVIGDPRKPFKWAYWFSVPLLALGLLLFFWLRLR